MQSPPACRAAVLLYTARNRLTLMLQQSERVSNCNVSHERGDDMGRASGKLRDRSHRPQRRLRRQPSHAGCKVQNPTPARSGKTFRARSAAECAAGARYHSHLRRWASLQLVLASAPFETLLLITDSLQQQCEEQPWH